MRLHVHVHERSSAAARGVGLKCKYDAALRRRSLAHQPRSGPRGFRVLAAGASDD
jgi:hypothetical protein